MNKKIIEIIKQKVDESTPEELQEALDYLESGGTTSQSIGRISKDPNAPINQKPELSKDNYVTVAWDEDKLNGVKDGN